MSLEKESAVINKNNKAKEMEIQRKIANYKIAQGMLYKYMFKAIDTERLNVIFYHSNWGKTEKFKDMIREEEFKELFNKEIKIPIISRDNIEIHFLNGSKIQFKYASDNARGYKHHYAVVDTNISREIFNNVIRPTSIPYYKQDGKIQELEDVWRIEFMEF